MQSQFSYVPFKYGTLEIREKWNDMKVKEKKKYRRNDAGGGVCGMAWGPTQWKKRWEMMNEEKK